MGSTKRRPADGRPPQSSEQLVAEMAPQSKELGRRVGTVRRHDDAFHPARGAFDTQHHRLIAGIAITLEPEGAADDDPGRLMRLATAAALDGLTVQLEIPVVALGLEELDGLGDGFGGVHDASLSTFPLLLVERFAHHDPRDDLHGVVVVEIARMTLVIDEHHTRSEGCLVG